MTYVLYYVFVQKSL